MSRVRSRLHHASLVAPPSDHQQLDFSQLRVILTADLDEEGVQIDMEKSGGYGESLPPPASLSRAAPF
jgi:hypothetical protein